MTADRPGLLVAGTAVILTGDWLPLAEAAALSAERRAGSSGLTDTTSYRRLAAAFRAAMSAGPQTDGPKPAVAHTDRWLTSKAAAELLGCTQRHAARLAPKLDGDKSTGHWLIPQEAILQHLEGKK